MLSDTTNPMTLLEKYRRVVQAHPDALALCFDSYSWTYHDLDQMSDAVAGVLQSKGVTQGDTVVLDCDRSPELVVFVLAVLKLRAMLLVVWEGSPANYVSASLAQIDKCHWLSSKKGSDESAQNLFKGKLESSTFLTITSLIKDDVLASYESSNVNALSNGDAKAHDDALDFYLITTSGTTGKPKLVQSKQGPLNNFIEWYVNQFDFQLGSRFSLLSGLGYDPMYRDIFTPLCSGGSIWIPSDTQLSQKRGLATWLTQNEIEVVHATPALAALVFNDDNAQQFEHLKLMALGGSALSESLVEQVQKCLPSGQIMNCYGTSETPQVMVYHLMDGQASDNLNAPNATKTTSTATPKGIPLGQARDNVTLFIRHEGKLTTNANVEGEICIQSDYLSNGYFGDEAATNAVFFLHDGVRTYATGDTGMIGDDGNLYFQGRHDRQVKYNGYRLQLEELEGVIANVSPVKHVSVVLNHSQGSDRLVCYVEAETHSANLIKEIKQQVIENLPNFMMPYEFIILDSMPLTPNGKVDVSDLASRALPEASEPVISAGVNAFQFEQALFQIWSNALGVDVQELSLDSSFFDVGGNSLLAYQLIHDINHKLGADMAITDLFLYPKVRDILTYLNEDASASQTSNVKEKESARKSRVRNLINKRKHLRSMYS